MYFNRHAHDTVPFVPELYSQEIQSSIDRVILPSTFDECTLIIIKGTLYKKGHAVVIKQDEYQYNLIVGRVCLILCGAHDNVYFVVQQLQTSFHPGLRLYEVVSQRQYECIAIQNLCSYQETR